jgi:hypothetical protein
MLSRETLIPNQRISRSFNGVPNEEITHTHTHNTESLPTTVSTTVSLAHTTLQHKKESTPIFS